MMKLPLLKRPRFDFWFFVKAVVILAMLFFLVYPFSTLITRSFFSKKAAGVTLDNYATFFSKKYYLDALKNTLLITFASSFTCLLVGAPMAYLMTRYNIFGKNVIYVCIILALMSPPFIGAYSWILLFGRAGFITRLFAGIGVRTPTIYGPGGIILVFTLHLFPYVYLYVAGALGSIDSSLEEAGENLGSSKLRRLFTVTLPVVMPSLLAGTVMVFMTALADFGTPMLLGEGKTRVLPVLVYDAYMSEIGGNANMASALSVIVVMFSLSVLLLQKFYVARKNYAMTALRPPKVVELHGWKRFLVTLPVALVAFLGLLPQLTVVVSSFIQTDFTGFIGGFTLDNYQKILSRLATNITNTYYFSAVAIVFIVIFGMLISYILVRKRGKVASIMDLLVMFPYVIPGSVLGVCLIVAFNRKPIILTGTAAIMIISYVVRKLPYTVRSGSAFLYQMDASVEEASISLGVSPMKTFFKVVARLMLPGILSGAILSWITCINELSSSIMLYSGRTSTIAVAIYQEVMRMSDGTAAALASILTLTTVASLMIFLRFSKGKVSVI
ncbi:MAG: iron ABC transporter permease [Eubacteriales bacterium]|jgi:iron(III) transport system permease protein|nr:iron ABC transporter permease [Eubacteriales bacterium]MDD4105847.1 iron ABC transporter permease [Eubacteriales bacterium]MDD4710893.1 iron ABC transporter permease [Eubacteriales bacterium]